MTEKKEPKFIGRYGEVLENVKCIEPDCYRNGSTAPPNKGTHMYMRGECALTKHESGTACFLVSKKTGKKDGFYSVRTILTKEQRDALGRKAARYTEYVEECHFLNDVLHGKEEHYYICHFGTQFDIGGLDGTVFETTWYRGKEISGKRAEKGREAKGLRRLLSLPSVQKAIKAGDVLKVKSAMTRALKKQMDRGE